MDSPPGGARTAGARWNHEQREGPIGQPCPDSSEGGPLTTDRPTAETTAATTQHQASASVLPSRTDALEDARSQRDHGASLADEAAGQWWRSTADQAIDAMAAMGRPFTADDLVEHTGLPEATSPRAMGARFLAAVNAGRITQVGFARSRRRSARCAVVRVWVGVQ